MPENLFEKHLKTGWDPFDTYKVHIHVGHLVGGIPMNPKLVESWINARCKKKTAEERAAIRDAHLEHLPEITEDQKEQQGIGFLRVDGKLVVEGRCFKAMLREAANIIKDTVPSTKGVSLYADGTGISALKSKTGDQVFVLEKYIQLDRTEPDRIAQRPIHVSTAQGPRDSIKVCEICDNADVHFTVKRHRGKGKQAVTEKALMAILDYARSVGFGADRSQGYGIFEVINVEKVEKKKDKKKK